MLTTNSKQCANACHLEESGSVQRVLLLSSRVIGVLEAEVDDDADDDAEYDK